MPPKNAREIAKRAPLINIEITCVSKRIARIMHIAKNIRAAIFPFIV
jgi:predicted amino acid racemase